MPPPPEGPSPPFITGYRIKVHINQSHYRPQRVPESFGAGHVRALCLQRKKSDRILIFCVEKANTSSKQAGQEKDTSTEPEMQGIELETAHG